MNATNLQYLFAGAVSAGLVVWFVPRFLEAPPEPMDHGHGDTAQDLYTCGMHPQVVNEGPGSCPICGMNLTPLRTETEPAERTTNVVVIDPVVVQNMGVRVATVKRGTIFRHVRTLGEIEVAEDEISVVNLRYSGWIESIRVDETGAEVKKGQTLFEIYSPEVVAAQEELLLAIRSGGEDGPRAQSARARLRNWDVPRGVVDRAVESGRAARTIQVPAPRAGFVLHKNVVEGARVQAGKDLYRIGDLKTIWVRAEVYEHDAAWVKLGQKASMELAFAAGRQIVGEVSYIYPTLNAKSRTLTVRLEFPNPGLELKPGMFATVLIETRKKDDVLVIPTESILHSGERQIVFVAESLGRYSPRDIDTGVVGDRHVTEVLSGLEEGERIVLSGQFLLDSESQLQEAINKLLAARLHTNEPPVEVEADSTWVCPMHPEIVDDHKSSCPICGMWLEKTAR
jgi:Cu(I)/Ag(I) efflux system membrane fusion protein/cobalt-zinc-cadmium efflux system membrane fusion protein